MIYLENDHVCFSVQENDDLKILKNNFMESKLHFADDPYNYEIRLYMTKAAMLCLGANLIHFAARNLYDWDMRTEPIGDHEVSSMGFGLAPGSGTLFLYQRMGQTELEDIIEPKKDTKNVEEKLFCIDIENAIAKEYEEDFNSMIQLEVFEKKTGNRQIDDVSLFLTKEGLVGMGVSLVKIAHCFQIGECYTVCRSNEPNLETKQFPGVVLTEHSVDLKIYCADLPDRITYREWMEKSWMEIGDKRKIIKKLQDVLAGKLSREEVARWATACRYGDGKGRCNDIREEVWKISLLDQKFENGAYQYQKQDIIDIIVALKEKI